MWGCAVLQVAVDFDAAAAVHCEANLVQSKPACVGLSSNSHQAIVHFPSDFLALFVVGFDDGFVTGIHGFFDAV